MLNIFIKIANYLKEKTIYGPGGHEINIQEKNNNIKKEFWTKIGKYKIYLVDGEEIRRKKSIDFTQGGHSIVFPFIPENEIWIEKMLNQKEQIYILLHELIETKLMEKGKKYEDAHSKANKIELKLRKKADYAPGIKTKEEYGEHLKLTPEQIVTLLAQEHNARKAGKHIDLRLGTPELGLLSWALRKEMPKPGDKPVLAIRQPLHSFEYKDFEGEIPEGYGAGIVKKLQENKVFIRKVSPHRIEFTISDEKGGQRYSLTNIEGKNWLLKNDTPTEAPNNIKLKIKDVSKEDIENLIKNKIVTPKIDGALALLQIKKGKPEIFSPRISEKTGLPITYTDRLKLLNKIPGINDAILRGEIFAQKGRKVLSPQEISGLLNMNLVNMLEKIQKENIKLKMALFDIENIKDPEEKFKKLKDLLKVLPKDKFMVVPTIKNQKKAIELLNKIKAGEYPLTQEGVVLYPLTGETPEKYKLRKEYDVIIRNIFPAEVQEGKNQRAGGFEYSLPDSEEIVGRVGTGFSHELLEDMLKNPEKYVGRRARIYAQEQFPSGAFRAPSFIALHESY